MKENEAFMPAEMIHRVLENASSDVVLVGGQALAFWINRFQLDTTKEILPAISRDVDFLTQTSSNTSPLIAFAAAIGGTAHIASLHSITALIGSAQSPADGTHTYNVDLIHRIIGLKKDAVFENSVEVEINKESGKMIRVMHPFDLLASRSANLHLLKEKQNEIGVNQLKLSIAVVQQHLMTSIKDITTSDLTEKDKHREIFNTIKIVNSQSRKSMAYKNSKKYGTFVADAVPAWLIASQQFWHKQWPHLKKRMSK
ncbi:hypothetical protein VDR63_20265 [Xanthomonas campestris pv. campestris]|uniref:hypothetical protein n=1 Tax=Xanthomonas campestris TaxID=339 RepID=UPI002B3A0F9F|nr:hypothetical protein [Xanthomonas campestris pv. campestris]WVL67932.1 hypothetical protein VDR24_015865 [Xanthomonas campestris pv. campestris]